MRQASTTAHYSPMATLRTLWEYTCRRKTVTSVKQLFYKPCGISTVNEQRYQLICMHFGLIMLLFYEMACLPFLWESNFLCIYITFARNLVFTVVAKSGPWHTEPRYFDKNCLLNLGILQAQTCRTTRISGFFVKLAAC